MTPYHLETLYRRLVSAVTRGKYGISRTADIAERWDRWARLRDYRVYTKWQFREFGIRERKQS